MAKREDVQTAMWGEDGFLSLRPDAKLLYVWSFTNPHCNTAGLYRISERVMAFHTGLPASRVSRALGELQDERFIHFDQGVLWVRSRAKHLWSKSPNLAKAIANDLTSLYGHPLVGDFLSEYDDDKWLRDALSKIGSTEPNGEGSW